MRTLLAVLGLVPVVLILEGCGSAPCKNDKLMTVTQSVDMSGDFKVSGLPEGMKIPPVPVTLTEKIDMENVSYYMAGNVKVEGFGKYVMMMMLNVKAKTAAFAIDASFPTKMSNCSIINMPWLQAPEVVSKCIKDAAEKEGMAPPKIDTPGVTVDGPSCSRSGNLDAWNMKVTVEQEEKGQKVKVEEELEYKVDDDFIFQEMTIGMKVAAQGQNGEMSGTMKATNTAKTGPTADDLDTTKWAGFTCKVQPMGGGGMPPMASPSADAQLQALTQALFQSRPGAAAIAHIMTNKQNEGRRLQGGPTMPPEMPGMAKCFMPAPTSAPTQASAVVSV